MPPDINMNRTVLVVSEWLQSDSSIVNARKATDRVTFCVGADRGFGLNLSRALASSGWDVVGSVRPQARAAGGSSVKEVRIF